MYHPGDLLILDLKYLLELKIVKYVAWDTQNTEFIIKEYQS